MLKILQVVAYYVPAWGYGGPPKVMYGMAKALAKREHEVTVYTTDAHDGTRRVETRLRNLDSIKVVYHRNLSNSLAWKKKKFIPMGFPLSLMKNIENFDLVHIADTRTIPNFVAGYFARKTAVPYVISPFGGLLGGYGTKLKMFAKKKVDEYFTRPLFLGADKVLAQTQHEESVAVEFGIKREKVEQLPLGIDLDEFADIESRRNEFRERFGVSPEEKIVLFLGRIHEYKGLQLLVRAFATVSRSVKNARLVIAGRDDGYLTAIEDLVRDLGLASKTVVTGALYGDERIAAYVDADVFAITPYHYEETSLAALEACACGTPVVVTDQCSFPWLKEYEGGYVINYDVQELADCLTKVLSDQELRNRMGSNARRMIEQKFDWTRIAARLEEIYLEVLGENRVK
ncbi:MAG: glycosyltransferase [Candidatus Eisenbacteria bacterium]|nr:glycosyltransferase [Candidatus Eisenbacteria bacterium]